MATKVLVPRLGEGVEEVTVTKWLKKEGDSVLELEPLLEVNTDKVDTEIPAPASGTILKIEMQAGQPARVGQLLAVIGAAGEKIEGATTPAAKEEKQKVKETAAATKIETLDTSVQQPSTVNRQPSTDIGFISPVVAKIAAEHGVNLQQVKGTGLNNRITKEDVLKYVESGGAVVPAESGSVTPDT